MQSIRSPFVVLLAGLLLSCFIAACGDSGQDAPTATPEPTAVADVTITDAAGQSVNVPGVAKRVVTLTDHDLDATVALGVTPVGVAAGRAGAGAAGLPSAPAYLASKLQGVTIVTSGNEVQFEKIVGLQPDLILAGEGQNITEEALSRLRQIAPTVVTNKQPDDWRTSVKGVAAALNRVDEGTKVLAAHDARAKQVQAKIGAKVCNSVSIVRWNPQGPAFMLEQHFASLVIKDAGLVRPPSQRKPGTSPSLVSLEALDQLDADWMFLGTLTVEAEQALTNAKAMPLFQQLNVVKSNHVVTIDGSIWTSRGGPIAAGLVLNDVEKALTAN